jgi:hypothetical protein
LESIELTLVKLVPDVSMLGDVTSTAERRVANLLAEIDPTVPTTAFHSVHLTRHEYKRMGEADFVLVMDDCVLVLEVKGGRVDRYNGSWRFTNRFGEQNLKREGPFEQAYGAMFALQSELVAAIPKLDVAFGILVITTDIKLPGDAEWEEWEHAGAGSMTVSKLASAIDSARNHALSTSRRNLTGGARSQISQFLRPDFDRVPRLDTESSRIELEYVRLLGGQYQVIASAESNDRVLCEGGAGTGKTLLAAETARRAASAGDSVLLTCKSPGVVNYVRELLRDSTVTVLQFDRIEDSRTYDIVVVDEAQDLMNDDDIARLDAVIRHGIHGGRWRVFCDVNNQSHIDGKFDSRTFEEVRATATKLFLSVNCRNTAPIILQTQLLTGADVGSPSVGAGPAVESIKILNDAEAATALEVQIARLVDQGVNREDIAVVSLRPQGVSSSAVQTSLFRRKRLRLSGDLESPNSTGLYRVEEIKGLEAAHICVVDVDRMDDALSISRLYVALTRARVSLWIAYSAVAWDRIASGQLARINEDGVK